VSDATASHGAHAARLRRRLEGDLDSILLRALAKQPTARYPTAEALADDLRRSLDQCRSRPGGSPFHRMERFVGRHRWMVVGSAAVGTALVVSTTVAVVQARRASAEKQLAQTEARNARAVGDFLTEVLSAADPQTPGSTPARDRSVKDAVDAAAVRIVSALDDEPRAKVSVLVTLSGVYSSLDLSDRSLALLQRRWRWRGRSSRCPTRPRRRCWSSWRTRRCSPANSIRPGRGWTAPSRCSPHSDTTSEHYAQALKIRGNLVRRGNTPDLRAGVALLERSTALFGSDTGERRRLGALFYLAQTSGHRTCPDGRRPSPTRQWPLAMHRVHMGFERPNAFSLRAAIATATASSPRPTPTSSRRRPGISAPPEPPTSSPCRTTASAG
jgi:hypothetical protein